MTEAQILFTDRLEALILEMESAKIPAPILSQQRQALWYLRRAKEQIEIGQKKLKRLQEE